MLKIVGTENHKVVDEKVLIDDNNKPSAFLLFLAAVEILLDAGLIFLIVSIAYKYGRRKNN